ncbi:MAG: MBL fold metallo-hydrolase [Candidatus Parabeggiatoa sp.]|nr:MBL fold metallo-hydrolase [Candidatus Parabeggiatoa sp.]
MAVELYNDGTHKCIAFYDLVSSDGVQANQFLLVNGNHSALLEPGGDLIYNDLFMHSYKYLLTKTLDYVIGSHQDPDILSSLDKWLAGSDCQIIVPAIWERFIIHFAAPGKLKDRIIGIPDQGMNIKIGQTILKAIPAHFLHSEGNFQFYDPVSKILFSGDLGASIGDITQVEQPVEDFEQHINNMIGFHRRYMSSNKVCRYWVNMVQGLDIEWIIPQHGPSFKGKAMIQQFLKWVEELECGIDLVTQETYQIP